MKLGEILHDIGINSPSTIIHGHWE